MNMLMQRKTLILATVIASICIVAFFVLPVYAEQQAPGAVQLINPLGGDENNPQGISAEADPIAEIYGRLIRAVLGVMGSVTLLVFVYGGVLWLTSAGNQERVKKGGQTMVWAAVGIFVIFASYAILTLVINSLLGKT